MSPCPRAAGAGDSPGPLLQNPRTYRAPERRQKLPRTSPKGSPKHSQALKGGKAGGGGVLLKEKVVLNDK